MNLEKATNFDQCIYSIYICMTFVYLKGNMTISRIWAKYQTTYFDFIKVTAYSMMSYIQLKTYRCKNVSNSYLINKCWISLLFEDKFEFTFCDSWVVWGCLIGTKQPYHKPQYSKASCVIIRTVVLQTTMWCTIRLFLLLPFNHDPFTV